MTAQVEEVSGAEKREVATLVDIIYRSASSPWGLSRFRREDGTSFNATGDFGQSILFEEFIMYGNRVPDHEGADFEVSRFTSTPPRSLNAISGYLTALTGAARSSTVQLVAHFGENTIDVIERSPDLVGDSGIPERDIERLITGWKTLRSDRLALAKIEVEGIPLYKLSKLARYYGNDCDLNHLIKTDPYALYIFFDDLPFTKSMALASQLGVPNATDTAVRGAVVAALRKEAWLGNATIEGKQLGQLVVKLLRVNPDLIRPLLAPAVAELRRLDVIHVEGRRVQLRQLHDAENRLFSNIAEWAQLKEEDLELDLVPSEEMGTKMLRPMKLKQAATKQLLTGITSLLGECFAVVECQTFEDQLYVAKALSLVAKAYDAEAIVTTYTTEMLQEAEKAIGGITPVQTYAKLIGLDEQTGIPLQRTTNPIEADAIIVIGADALGVEEMAFLIEAAPKTGRLYLLGSPKDLPTLSVGQPFADLVDSRQFKTFHSRFWGIESDSKHDTQDSLWSAEFGPNIEDFDPTQPISWLECADEELETFIPTLLGELQSSLGLNPLGDVRVVMANTLSTIAVATKNAITEKFSAKGDDFSFQGRKLTKGIPIIIRQPLESADCPAFSVYTPESLSNGFLTLTAVDGVKATVEQEHRIDIFEACVITPKFIRGRRYEYVVLVAPTDQIDSINQELLSSLFNTCRRSLIVVGATKQVIEQLSDRPSYRVRSSRLDWESEA